MLKRNVLLNENIFSFKTSKFPLEIICHYNYSNNITKLKIRKVN